jgi:hypothetical protein
MRIECARLEKIIKEAILGEAGKRLELSRLQNAIGKLKGMGGTIPPPSAAPSPPPASSSATGPNAPPSPPPPQASPPPQKQGTRGLVSMGALPAPSLAGNGPNTGVQPTPQSAQYQIRNPAPLAPQSSSSWHIPAGREEEYSSGLENSLYSLKKIIGKIKGGISENNLLRDRTRWISKQIYSLGGKIGNFSTESAFNNYAETLVGQLPSKIEPSIKQMIEGYKELLQGERP